MVPDPGVDGDGPAGRRIGCYRLLSEIGRGGMGVVHRAEDELLGRQVALKIFAGSISASGEERQRFEREARALATIGDDRIVRIFEARLEDEQSFLAMQLLPGPSLDRLLPLSAREAARHVAEAARGVAAAHAAGVLHRDLKPANLILGPDDRVRVADFGIARLRSAEDPALTRTGQVMGTPAFMSPEQADESREADERSDVYSLGATLYALIGGRPPFADRDPRTVLCDVIDREPTPLSRIAPAIPGDLEAIVETAMAKEPAHRYHGARELAEDLERFLDGRIVRARRLGPAGRVRRWLWRRRRGVAPIAGLLALALGVTAHDEIARRNSIAEIEAADSAAGALVRSAWVHDEALLRREVDPGVSPEALETRIRALYDGTDLDPVAAQDRTREAFARYPAVRLASARSYLEARRCLARADLPSARIALAAAYDLDPRGPWADLALEAIAATWEAEGDPERAESIGRSASLRQGAPGPVEVGRELLELGAHDRAIARFRSATDPDARRRAVEGEIDALTASGRLEEALARASALDEGSPPTSVAVLFRRAHLERRLARFEDHARTAGRLLARTDLTSADRRLAETMSAWARELTAPASFLELRGPASTTVEYAGSSLVLQIESTGEATAWAEWRLPDRVRIRLEMRPAAGVRAHAEVGSWCSTVELVLPEPRDVRFLSLSGPRTFDLTAGETHRHVSGVPPFPPGTYQLEIGHGTRVRLESFDARPSR